MKKNSEIRMMARTELKGSWTQPVLSTLMYLLILGMGAVTTSGTCSIVLYIVAAVLLIGISMPMTYCYTANYLEFIRGNKDEMVGSLFDFFNYYFKSLGITLLVYVKIMLWSILLIVPGIVKGLSYSMAFFIMKDNPEMTIGKCVEGSEVMMKGHKMELFKLLLSFIGWWLLSIITMGIGYLWLMPYMYSSLACFYEEVRMKYEIDLAKEIE